MRALIGTFLFLTACAAEQKEPNWAFAVTVSNKQENCTEVDGDVKDESNQQVPGDELCSCTDSDGASCIDEITPTTEVFSYELFIDGESVAIEIEGQPFASGRLLGCALEYESPTWRATTSNGNVQWSVTSQFVKADGATDGCPIPGQYDFLGIEEYTVIESDNVQYPVGRTVRKVISGNAKAVGGE